MVKLVLFTYKLLYRFTLDDLASNEYIIIIAFHDSLLGHSIPRFNSLQSVHPTFLVLQDFYLKNCLTLFTKDDSRFSIFVQSKKRHQITYWGCIRLYSCLTI